MANRNPPKAKGYHWDQVEAHIHPSNGRPSCRWCRGAVKPPKRTFCGNPVCLAEWQRRTRWDLTRRTVYAKSNGLCALCGFDLKGVDTGRFLTQLKLADRAAAAGPAKWSAWKVKPELDAAGKPYPRFHWLRLVHSAMEWHAEHKCVARDAWEVDHVTPVNDGGDWFSYENLRLLCVDCHRRVTADYARERARRRRERGLDLA